jgi:hypothetical protein
VFREPPSRRRRVAVLGRGLALNLRFPSASAKCDTDDKPGRGVLAPASIACVAVLTASLFLITPPAGTAQPTTPRPKPLTLYSVAEQEQFMNNADGRQRGEGSNPFGTFSDLAPPTTPERNGPYPGDAADYSFNLYSNPALTKRVGSAVIFCDYNFRKNAFCDETFHLNHGGSLVAAGEFNFDADSFALAITGGIGSYSGVRGEVKTTPSSMHAERLSFMLT